MALSADSTAMTQFMTNPNARLSMYRGNAVQARKSQSPTNMLGKKVK